MIETTIYVVKQWVGSKCENVYAFYTQREAEKCKSDLEEKDSQPCVIEELPLYGLMPDCGFCKFYWECASHGWEGKVCERYVSIEERQEVVK